MFSWTSGGHSIPPIERDTLNTIYMAHVRDNILKWTKLIKRIVYKNSNLNSTWASFGVSQGTILRPALLFKFKKKLKIFLSSLDLLLLCLQWLSRCL